MTEAALPKLNIETEHNKDKFNPGEWISTDVQYIGDKKIPESYLQKMELMPVMTQSEAHTYLRGIVGYEWNTLHALRAFDEWFFIDNEDGTFRGSEYESDEEIRSRLEKEADQRAEKEVARRAAAAA